MLATTRISVNVDEDVKQKAQRILNEIGMDMTTAIELLLRTIVREEKIPFELSTHKAYREEAHRQFIRTALEKSKLDAASPDTKWLTQDDVMTKLERQREARHGL